MPEQKNIVSLEEQREQKIQIALENLVPDHAREKVFTVVVAPRPEKPTLSPPWLLSITNEELKPISLMTKEEADALAPDLRRKMIARDEQYTKQWLEYEKTGDPRVFWK